MRWQDRLYAAVRDPARAALILFLAVWLGLFVVTLSDYGPAWDVWELPFGDRQLMFYATLDPVHLDPRGSPPLDLYGDPDHPDFSRVIDYPRKHGHHMWPLGPTLASASKFVFWRWLGLLDAIDAHHVVLAIFAAVFFVAFFRWIRANVDALAAVTAVIAVGVFPRFWAHAHVNLKDIPSLVIISLVLMAFHRGVVQERTRSILLAGALAGAALATKANALFIPVILGPWFGWQVWRDRRARHRWPSRRVLVALALTPVLALLTAAALWPWLLHDFPRRLVLHGEHLLTRGGSGWPHFKIMPLLHLVTTMPLPMLVLVLLGLGIVLARSLRARTLASLDALLLLWLAVPVLRVSVPRASDFDVIRHWIEFLPAAAAFAGIAVSGLAAAARRAIGPRGDSRAFASAVAGAVLIWFSPTVVWNVANHPHQLVFYNSLVGGCGGAQRRAWPESTDYFGVSYRRGMQWLNAHAERGAVVVVPVAAQIAAVTARGWLRPDLRLCAPPYGPLLRPRKRDTVYMMYVTRRAWYQDALRRFDRERPVVHRIRVDGGDILKILRVQ